jgi:signal transduction histidine kinase
MQDYMPEPRPLTKRIRSTPVLIGVLVALTTILAVGGILATLTSQMLFNNSREALAVGDIRQEIESATEHMDQATRDYILTHDPRYLEQYRNEESRLPDLWDRMTVEIDAMEGTLPNRNAQLGSLVTELRTSIDRWQSTWADVQMRRGSETTVAAVSTETLRTLAAGEQSFADVERANDDLAQALRATVGQNNVQRNNAGNVGLWLLVVMGLISVSSGFVALRTAQRESRVEEEAREREENERRRLQAVVDNLPVPVRLASVQGGRVILQNQFAEAIFPAEVWNRLGAAQRARHFDVCTPDGEPLDPEDWPVARVIREGRPVSEIEFTAASPTGRRHILSGAAPITDESGKIVAVVETMQDVTRMREMDQRKDEFIATAAHELRNPLTALSGHNQLLQRQVISSPEADPDMVRHTQVMSRQITRLTELIERLLDSSRIQLGRLTLDMDAEDLATIARSVISDYETTDEGHHPIELITPPQIVGYWDATRLEEVLSNLVGNALRYTPDESPVTVEIEDEGTWARVRVSDRGPGIPADQRQRLFDRYFQTGPLNSAVVETVGSSHLVPGSGRRIEVRPVPPKKKGLGLGLYICSEIVKAHGGQIGVEPNPGGGSTFWFRIPKARALA